MAGAEPQTPGPEPQTAVAEPQTAGAEPQTPGAELQTAGAELQTAGAAEFCRRAIGGVLPPGRVHNSGSTDAPRRRNRLHQPFAPASPEL